MDRRWKKWIGGNIPSGKVFLPFIKDIPGDSGGCGMKSQLGVSDSPPLLAVLPELHTSSELCPKNPKNSAGISEQGMLLARSEGEASKTTPGWWKAGKLKVSREGLCNLSCECLLLLLWNQGQAGNTWLRSEDCWSVQERAPEAFPALPLITQIRFHN